MADPKNISKAKLVVAVMFKDENINKDITKLLISLFGKITHRFDYDFTFTKYYEPEMGANLKKFILIFKKKIHRTKLSDIKLITNGIEKNYEIKNKRTVNIDPGYMTKGSVVLASAKDLPHRVYLDKGIFADVVLTYYNGSFFPSERTFKDYKDKQILDFFNKIRND